MMRNSPRARFVDKVKTIKPGDPRFPDYTQAAIPRPRWTGGMDVTVSDASGPRERQAQQVSLRDQQGQPPSIQERPHPPSKYDEIRNVDAANQKALNIKIEAARVAEARRIDQIRRQEMLDKRKAYFAKMDAEQSAQIENGIVLDQIVSVCESHGLSAEQATAIGNKLRAEGTATLPDFWENEALKSKGAV